MASAREPIAVGERLEVEIGPIAHGGHCIAHARGRTLLVRHAIPGERIVVEVTEVASKVCRADAIEVLTASPDRVTPPCPQARPGGCGGCDFQHVELARQRELKTQVLRDSLKRFADIDTDAIVSGLPGDDSGLGWRTRVSWHVDRDGRAGLYGARSHRVVPVEHCPISAPPINAWLSRGARHRGAGDIVTATGDAGDLSVVIDGTVVEGHTRVQHRVGDRSWRISAKGFWQVHPAAAQVLVDAVLAAAQPRPGQTWWDLYAGAGLFSAFLGEAVGATGRVEAVEASADAIRDGRRALHDLNNVTLVTAPVDQWLETAVGPVHGIVLDPPRSGAGQRVVTAIAAKRPQRIVYVACDPVALARDIALFRTHGFELRELEAFDLFPMTHHVEAVALLSGA